MWGSGLSASLRNQGRGRDARNCRDLELIKQVNKKSNAHGLYWLNVK
jgi:hypothetical protein